MQSEVHNREGQVHLSESVQCVLREVHSQLQPVQKLQHRKGFIETEPESTCINYLRCNKKMSTSPLFHFMTVLMVLMILKKKKKTSDNNVP